jgi:hypothetical protein
MGFPSWTLWGMGLAALGALLATVLAFIAQSPLFLTRIGLGGRRLDLRARAFTGYALALMFLAGGFFLAGVPIDMAVEPDTISDAQPLVGTTAVTTPAEEAISISREESTPEPPVPTTVPRSQTPQSGAFTGPPSAAEATAEEGAATETTDSPTSPTTGLTATSSPQPTESPTTTPTPLPTNTPTPTLTPTPIDGETAVINTGSSTLWVRRTPGGQTLVLVMGGDTVILKPGHANQGGILWQEIMTLDGTVGWVEEEFITKAES